MRTGRFPLAALLLVLASTIIQVSSTNDLYWEGEEDASNEFLEVKNESPGITDHLKRLKRNWFSNWLSPATDEEESVTDNPEDPGGDGKDDDADNFGSGIPDKAEPEPREKTLRVTFLVMEPYSTAYSNRDSPEFLNISRSLANAADALFETLPGTQRSSLVRIQSLVNDEFLCKVTLDISTTGYEDTDKIKEILRNHIKYNGRLGETSVRDGDFSAQVIDPGATLECDSSIEFKCDEDVCLPLSARCDGREDCKDGTDESDCATPPEASPLGSPTRDEYETKKESPEKEANNPDLTDYDTNGNEDEDNNNFEQTDDRFPESQSPEITPGSDAKTPEQTEAPTTSIWDNLSLWPSSRGDLGEPEEQSTEASKPDDATTKRYWTPETKTVPECPAEHMRCDETRCVELNRRCDGVSDCVDGADETGCPEENIASDINASEVQETQTIFNNGENIMVMDGIKLQQTFTDDGPSTKMSPIIEVIPSCSKYNQEGEQSDSSIEKELESFFGDISDTDDPTYLPPNYSPRMERVGSDELITLEDLLGNKENERIEHFEVEEVQNNIEAVQQCGIQHSEATALVVDLLTELFKKTWLLIKPIKRWRKSDPSSWARNVAKKRRADGLSYRTKSKVRPAKVPKDIDCGKCQFKCTDVFAKKDREDICRFFWNLNFQGKKNFILGNVVIQLPKRILSAHNRRRTEKKYTKKCYLTKENEKRQVCQKFFCKTLCISPSVITDAIKKRNEMNCFDVCDARGGHTPANNTKPDIVQGIRNHIESFPCMEAHYSRKDTQRKYLDKNLNIRKMYLLYKDECLKNKLECASEITYRRIFSNEYNLSFFVPRKDQCLICTNYALADTEKKKELEDVYLAHQERKKTCNKEKEKDKTRANADESFSSVTFDLQAVLQIPTCDVGLLYYSRKLCVYNLTVYEAGLPNNAYCFTWSEVNGRKGSCEIGTILLYYLSNCVSENVSEISLFSDTCGGQNRNQFVAALLLWAVQKIEHLKVIEQKFLESGHSQMEADSMHSSIESAKKNTSIFSMMEWISIFKRARRRQAIKVDGKKIIREPYHVKEFKYNEFLDLKHLANAVIKNRTKDEKGKTVQWLKIKRIRYVKGEERKIYFNYDMSESFDVMEIGDNNSSTSKIQHEYSTRKKMRHTRTENNSPADHQLPDQLNRLYQEPLKITEAKKRDLINLCKKGIIPEELHGWFENLKTEKLYDRLPEPAISESENEEEF